MQLTVQDAFALAARHESAGRGTEARRIYATLSESTEQRECRRLVEFIQGKGGSITVRALQNSNSAKYRGAGEAEGKLDGLVEAGLARWVEGEPIAAWRAVRPAPGLGVAGAGIDGGDGGDRPG